MVSTITSLVAAILGLGLIATSYYWTSPLGPTPQWSEEQARELADAAAEYHRQAHEHGHDEPLAADKRGRGKAAEEAKREFERRQAMLQAARSDHRRTAAILKWSGITLATGGVVGFFLVQSLARTEPQ